MVADDNFCSGIDDLMSEVFLIFCRLFLVFVSPMKGDNEDIDIRRNKGDLGKRGESGITDQVEREETEINIVISIYRYLVLRRKDSVVIQEFFSLLKTIFSVVENVVVGN